MIDLPQKIVCVGLNYRDHAEEQGVDLPERPLLFAKWPNTLIGAGEPIRVPSICKNPDYEAELGLLVGRRRLSERSASLQCGCNGVTRSRSRSTGSARSPIRLSPATD